MRKIHNYLELVRIPGVFSAQADILAGFLMAGAPLQKTGGLLLLLIASSGFYSAGMALNDAFDADIDAGQRPERPVPSGRVARRTAFGVGFSLLGLGLMISALVGLSSFIVAVLLTIAIISYDGGIKHWVWGGPANMGACRYLNLLLGLSIASISASSLLIPLLTGVYIFGVTALSRRETEGNDIHGLLVCGLTIAAVLFLFWFFWLTGILPCAVGLGLCVLWSLALIRHLIVLSDAPTPANTQKMIKRLLMGLVILDGVIVAGFGPWPWSIAVWLMLVPASIVARRFYVT